MASARARMIARRLRADGNLTGVLGDEELVAVTRAHSLRLIEHTLPGDTLAVMMCPTIGLRAGLPLDWRRWLTALAIGYRMLSPTSRVTVTYRRLLTHQERAHEEFAGWLLLGTSGVGAAWAASGPWASAEVARIPAECYTRWCGYVGYGSPGWRATG